MGLGVLIFFLIITKGKKHQNPITTAFSNPAKVFLISKRGMVNVKAFDRTYTTWPCHTIIVINNKNSLRDLPCDFRNRPACHWTA